MVDDERRARRTVSLLGLPTLALALSVTIVTTYLPVVARDDVGSDLVVGGLIGVEGLIALWLPLVVGAASDRLRTPLGGRLPFLIAATPVLVAGLLALAVARSVGTLIAATLLMFVGYFLAYEPYRALYPDAVPDALTGRSQASQALWRGVGTGVALLCGGLLLTLGRGAPFVFAAALSVVCVAVFLVILLRLGVPQVEPARGGMRDAARAVLALVAERRELRAFLVANGLWELSLAALKTFVVLYVTTGLGFSQTSASLVIGGVAVVVVLAALASGPLADRFGPVRVLEVALPIHGAGFLVPLLTDSHLLVSLAIPFVALGGGVIMSLPYAVLMPLMPDGEHGALTGYYSLSRGLGTWLGPLAAGGAVTVLAGPFGATHGYQAVWGVCAAAILLSLWPLRALRRAMPRSGAT